LAIGFRQPFDLLAKTTITLEKKKAAGGVTDDPFQIWLPGRTRTSDQAVNSRLTLRVVRRRDATLITINSAQILVISPDLCDTMRRQATR